MDKHHVHDGFLLFQRVKCRLLPISQAVYDGLHGSTQFDPVLSKRLIQPRRGLATMPVERRFKTLAVFYGELLKFPDYDGEAERLLRHLRRGRSEEQVSEATPARPRRAPISASRRIAAGR